MLICVFRHSPKTPFSPLQKHRKYRCFDSILGLREKENIINSVVLSLVGAKNIANYDVLGTFLNASFRTTGQKHRKIQCFCCFAILIFNFCFLACCKNIVNTMVFAVCGLPFFPVVCCCSARARAFWVSFWGCVRRARARRATTSTTTTTTTTTTTSSSTTTTASISTTTTTSTSTTTTTTTTSTSTTTTTTTSTTSSTTTTTTKTHQKPATATQHELTLSSPALPVGALALE